MKEKEEGISEEGPSWDLWSAGCMLGSSMLFLHGPVGKQLQLLSLAGDYGKSLKVLRRKLKKALPVQRILERTPEQSDDCLNQEGLGVNAFTITFLQSEPN